MIINEPIRVDDRAGWRSWLEQHHVSSSEAWLIIPKAHGGLPGMSLAEAIEEALCFGWIDSIMKSIDDRSYALRFTPRKAGSNWSVSNKRRVQKLIQEGRMTPAGMAKVTFPLDETCEARQASGLDELSGEVHKILKSNPVAWANFEKLPASAREIYLRWIVSARKEDTRLKRARTAVELLEYNLRLGIESPAKMLEKARANRRDNYPK